MIENGCNGVGNDFGFVFLSNDHSTDSLRRMCEDDADMPDVETEMLIYSRDARHGTENMRLKNAICSSQHA